MALELVFRLHINLQLLVELVVDLKEEKVVER